MSTVGVCVFSHYCGGELEKVTVFTETNSCCDGEEESGMSDDGCCKNESVHLTFQKDFTFYTVASDLKAPENQLFIVPAFINDLSVSQKESNHFLSLKNIHPPNLVQHEIVSSSVMRI
jgi:hypothetical protein